MGRIKLALATAAVVLGATGTAAAHLMDHAPPGGTEPAPASPAFQSGGQNAEWELVGTIPTGNPHTDLDFFQRGGETYASVGTLGAGANGGGQSIVKLTEGGKVSPQLRDRPPVGDLRLEPERRARPPARRRGHAPRAACCSATPNVHDRARRRAGAHRRHRRRGPLPRPGHARARERARGRARDRRRHRPRAAQGDRAHQPHRRGAHGQRRPQAAAHRLRRHLRLRLARQGRRPAVPPERGPGRRRPLRPRRLRGRRLRPRASNFPAGTHDRRRSASAAGPRSTATATRTSDMALGHDDQGRDLRLPRARDLPRRPPHLRLGRGAARTST